MDSRPSTPDQPITALDDPKITWAPKKSKKNNN